MPVICHRRFFICHNSFYRSFFCRILHVRHCHSFCICRVCVRILTYVFPPLVFAVNFCVRTQIIIIICPMVCNMRVFPYKRGRFASPLSVCNYSDFALLYVGKNCKKSFNVQLVPCNILAMLLVEGQRGWPY